MGKKTSNFTKALANALSMSTSFVAAVALGYFSGSWLDDRFGTAPYLMLIMLLLGVATGLKIMYDQAFKKGSNNNSQPPKDGRSYKPSKEIIAVLDEAKKMVSELDQIDPRQKETKKE